jgi:hypothetical protein
VSSGWAIAFLLLASEVTSQWGLVGFVAALLEGNVGVLADSAV